MGTYTRWELTDHHNGTMHICMETNDNNDDGYPDGEVTIWERDTTEKIARELAGISHVGYFGHPVDVYLDGKKI
jgi:hypothetical protein